MKKVRQATTKQFFHSKFFKYKRSYLQLWWCGWCGCIWDELRLDLRHPPVALRTSVWSPGLLAFLYQIVDSTWACKRLNKKWLFVLQSYDNFLTNFKLSMILALTYVEQMRKIHRYFTRNDAIERFPNETRRGKTQIDRKPL